LEYITNSYLSNKSGVIMLEGLALSEACLMPLLIISNAVFILRILASMSVEEVSERKMALLVSSIMALRFFSPEP